MTTLSWDDLWEIGTALNIRKKQIEESIKVLAKYEDIVEMNKRELAKILALEVKVDRARMLTEFK
jgi:acyl-CoA reductase-like NAD-dependent aldehyde dehydrogenase